MWQQRRNNSKKRQRGKWNWMENIDLVSTHELKMKTKKFVNFHSADFFCGGFFFVSPSIFSCIFIFSQIDWFCAQFGGRTQTVLKLRCGKRKIVIFDENNSNPRRVYASVYVRDRVSESEKKHVSVNKRSVFSKVFPRFMFASIYFNAEKQIRCLLNCELIACVLLKQNVTKYNK